MKTAATAFEEAAEDLDRELEIVGQDLDIEGDDLTEYEADEEPNEEDFPE